LLSHLDSCCQRIVSCLLGFVLFDRTLNVERRGREMLAKERTSSASASARCALKFAIASEILLGASNLFSISFFVTGPGTTLSCTGAGWLAMWLVFC